MPDLKRIADAARWPIGLGILAFIIWSLDLREVLGAIAGSNRAWLLAGFALILVSRFVTAYQLAVAIRHHDVAITVTRAFVVNSISSFYSLFLPGQIASGVVKWYRLSQPSGKRAEVFATIVFVRVLNSMVALAFGTLAISMDRSLGLMRLSWLGVGLFVAIAGLMFFVATDRFAALMSSLSEQARGKGVVFLHRMLEKAIRSLRHFRHLDRVQVAKLIAVPLVTQLLAAAMYLSAALALGLEIGFITLLWIVSLVYFIHLVPLTISGLGIREGVLVFLLPHYGVDPTDALAFSLIVFGFTLSIGLLGGILEFCETVLLPSFRHRSVVEDSSAQDDHSE